MPKRIVHQAEVAQGATLLGVFNREDDPHASGDLGTFALARRWGSPQVSATQEKLGLAVQVSPQGRAFVRSDPAPVPISGHRATSGLVSGATVAKNLFSIYNPGGGWSIRIKRMCVQAMMFARGDVHPQIHIARTADVPSGGTVLDTQKIASWMLSPVAVLRQEPTFTAATDFIRLHPGTTEAAASQDWAKHPPLHRVFSKREEYITLAGGEALGVRVDASDTDFRFIVFVLWDER